MSPLFRSRPLLVGVLVAAILVAPSATPVAAYYSSTNSAGAIARTTTLNPPTDVTAQQADPAAATVRLSWAAPAPPSVTPGGYFVQRHEGGSVEPACGTAVDDLTGATACLDEGLLPGHTYTWVVTASYRSWTAPSAPTTPLTVTTSAELAVTDVEPAAGSVDGGTAISVSGTGFQPGATLTVGGRPAMAVIVTGPNVIAAVTPRGRAGSADLVVINPDGTAATLAEAFTYIEAPSLRWVSPGEGPASGGTLVTITGRTFTPDTAVHFGDALATEVTVVNTRTLTVATPAHEPGVVSITLTTPGGSDTLDNAFTYRAEALTVTDVEPAAGTVDGGTAISVSGTGFQPGATLTVGGRPATAVIVTEPTAIAAVTPPGRAGSADLVVANPDGTSATLTEAFTYTEAPSLRRVSPREGPTTGGTLVTITGRTFTSDAVVHFGDSLATEVTVVNTRTLTVLSPAHEPGVVSITVTTPGGSDTLDNAFTYRAQALTVTGVEPKTGPADEGAAGEPADDRDREPATEPVEPGTPSVQPGTDEPPPVPVDEKTPVTEPGPEVNGATSEPTASTTPESVAGDGSETPPADPDPDQDTRTPGDEG